LLLRAPVTVTGELQLERIAEMGIASGKLWVE
jgi:hypothetical protein